MCKYSYLYYIQQSALINVFSSSICNVRTYCVRRNNKRDEWDLLNELLYWIQLLIRVIIDFMCLMEMLTWSFWDFDFIIKSAQLGNQFLDSVQFRVIIFVHKKVSALNILDTKSVRTKLVLPQTNCALFLFQTDLLIASTKKSYKSCKFPSVLNGR